MLGLRYLACRECQTVFAVPDDPDGAPDDRAECRRCGAAGLGPLPSDPATAAYFAGDLDGDAES